MLALPKLPSGVNGLSVVAARMQHILVPDHFICFAQTPHVGSNWVMVDDVQDALLPANRLSDTLKLDYSVYEISWPLRDIAFHWHYTGMAQWALDVSTMTVWVCPKGWEESSGVDPCAHMVMLSRVMKAEAALEDNDSPSRG